MLVYNYRAYDAMHVVCLRLCVCASACEQVINTLFAIE